MSDQQVAEVNQRLAEPEDVDLAHARMLGFFVVGQLASRHGIKVQLRRSWEAGVTVLVLLPADLLVRPEEASWPDPSGSRAAIPWTPVAQAGLPHQPGSPHRQ